MTPHSIILAALVKQAYAALSPEDLTAFDAGTATAFDGNSWLDRNKMERRLAGESDWASNAKARAMGAGRDRSWLDVTPAAEPSPAPAAVPAPSGKPIPTGTDSPFFRSWSGKEETAPEEPKQEAAPAKKEEKSEAPAKDPEPAEGKTEKSEPAKSEPKTPAKSEGESSEDETPPAKPVRQPILPTAPAGDPPQITAAGPEAPEQVPDVDAPAPDMTATEGGRFKTVGDDNFRATEDVKFPPHRRESLLAQRRRERFGGQSKVPATAKVPATGTEQPAVPLPPVRPESRAAFNRYARNGGASKTPAGGTVQVPGPVETSWSDWGQAAENSGANSVKPAGPLTARPGSVLDTARKAKAQGDFDRNGVPDKIQAPVPPSWSYDRKQPSVIDSATAKR